MELKLTEHWKLKPDTLIQFLATASTVQWVVFVGANFHKSLRRPPRIDFEFCGAMLTSHTIEHVIENLCITVN